MRISAEDVRGITAPVLPEGYSFRFFAAGADIAGGAEGSPADSSEAGAKTDAAHWARIETSVLEFDSEEFAEKYFTATYMPRLEELQRRCVFVVNPGGLPIATSTAWFSESAEFGRQAALHWVAVCPEEQKRGIGEAIVSRALQLFSELEPGLPVWLHTQTWSHAAVRLYHRLGFQLMKTESFAKSSSGKLNENEYDQAIEILKKILPAEFAKMEEAAL